MLDTQNKTERQWLWYALRHPVCGFEDMRWKKSGSVVIAVGIVLLWLVGEILCDRWYGMQFVMPPTEPFRMLPYAVRTAGLFLTGVLGNWAVCTLLDGEGRLKQIAVYGAYALLPYVVQLYVQTLLSHVLIRDEAVFLAIVQGIGLCWSAVLLFQAIRTAHQYSIPRTIAALLLTVGMMLILLILLILLTALFQQVWTFITDVYAELVYRWRM